MTPYTRMVLGYAVSRDRVSLSQSALILRALHRYRLLPEDERERVAAPFARIGWPLFIWTLLRGSVDRPFTYSVGMVIALLLYAGVAVQLAVMLLMWALKASR